MSMLSLASGLFNYIILPCMELQEIELGDLLSKNISSKQILRLKRKSRMRLGQVSGIISNYCSRETSKLQCNPVQFSEMAP